MVERFQQFFDSLVEEVVVLDQQLRITYANPAWIRRVGLPLSEVTDCVCHSVLAGSDGPCDPQVCACSSVLETGKAAQYAGCGDESSAFLGCDKVSVSPVLDSQGQVSHVVLVRHALTAAATSNLAPYVGPRRSAIPAKSHLSELKSAFHAILEQLGCAVALDSASIRLLDHWGWSAVAHCGFPPELELEESTLPRDEPVLVAMQSSLQSATVADVIDDDRWWGVKGAEYIRSWIGAPLLTQGQMIGVLNIYRASPGHFGPQDAKLAMAFASQAALVVENASLRAADRRRAAQLGLISELSQQVLSILNPEELLQYAAEAIHARFGFFHVDIFIADLETESMIFHSGSSAQRASCWKARRRGLPIGGKSVVGQVAATSEPYVASDVRDDPLVVPDSLLAETRAELAVPIRVGDRVVGVLDLNSTQVNVFDRVDLFVAQSLAEQLAIGLENARLFASEANRRREAETLQAATQALSSSLDLDAVLDVILSKLQEVVPYDSASVQQLHGDTLEIVGGRGFPNLDELSGLGFDVDTKNHPNWQIVQTHAPVILDDAPVEYHAFLQEPHSEAEIRSWMGVPLLFGSKLIGMIALDKREPGFYTQEHARLALSFATQAAIAVENASHFEATAQRVVELEAIRQASLSLTASLELESVLQAILENALQLLTDVQDTHIFLYQDGRLSFGAALWAGGIQGQPWSEPRQNGLTYTVARSGEPIFVADMRSHSLYQGAPDHWVGSIVGLPLKTGDRVVGVMTVAFEEPRELPANEMRLLRLLADQAAIGIENARLFAAEHQSRLRLKSIQSSATALSAELHLDSLLEQIVSEAARAFAAHATSVMLWDQEKEFLEVRANHGLSVEYAQMQRISRKALPESWGSEGSSKPLYVKYLAEAPLGKGDLVVQEGLCSLLAIPLARHKPLVGLLNIYSKGEPRVFTPAEIELAEAFAAHASVMIANAQLYRQAESLAAELSSRADRLALLNRISTAVSSSLDTDEILETAVTEIANAFGVKQAGIVLFDWDAGCGLVVAEFQEEPDGTADHVLIPLDGNPLIERVIETQRPVAVLDASADPLAVGIRRVVKLRGIQSVLVVPLVVKGKVVGTVGLDVLDEKREFSREEMNLAQTIANQVASAIENARLFQETESRLKELTALVSVGTAMTTLELDDVLDSVADNALQAVSAEIGSVYLLDEERDLLIPQSVRGRRSDELHLAVFRPGEGTIGQVLATGETLAVDDASADRVFLAKTEAAHLILNTLTVPLIVKERIIGTLEVCNKVEGERFTQSDEHLLTAFAAQASIAIENARLFQAEREHRELAEALRQATSAISRSLDLDQVLDELLHQVSRVIPSDVANIMLIEGDCAHIVRARGYERFGERELVSSVVLSLDSTSSLRKMRETGRSLVIPDTTQHPYWEHYPETSWLRSYAGAPIFVRGEVIGFLNVDSATPGFFTQTHADRLQAFADQASLAVANARLYREVSRHLEEVLILNRFARAVISTLDVDEVLRRGLAVLVGVRNFEHVRMLLIDEDAQDLWLHPALEDTVPEGQRQRIPLGEGVAGQVAESGKSLRLNDLPTVEADLVGHAEIRSELCVPLLSGQRVIGVLDVLSSQAKAFSEGDERFLGTLAVQLSTVLENARLFEEAQLRVRELTALTQVSQTLNKAADLGTILDIVLEETFGLLDGQEGSVILIDPPESNKLRIVAHRGLSLDVVESFNARPVYTHEGTYRRALRTGQIVEVAKTDRDPDFLHDVGSLARSITNIPLLTERGAIGLLAVDGLPQDDAARRLLMALADMAAVAIAKERLRLETADRLSEVTTLFTLATQITSSLALGTVLDSIVTILKMTLDCRACSIFLLDRDKDSLVLEAGIGMSTEWKGVARLQVGEGVSGQAVAERRTIYVRDAHSDPDFIFFDPQVRSLLVVPLIVRDRVVGTLSIDDIKPNAFDDEVRLLTIAAAQAAVAIDNAQLYESLQKSYSDLEGAYDELRQLDQMKSEFVQNISHELRTPLTFIKGYLELLHEGEMGSLSEEQQMAIDIVVAKAEVLARLVDDIISLQQAGRKRLEFSAIALAELGHAAIHAARASASAAGLQLLDEIPDDLPDVLGDKQRLLQVFDNLLGNALKFSNKGDSITVRMLQDNGEIRTEVQDTGIGIPEEQQSRIFDRFYQVDGKTTRRYGGTGLGLAIVKQIIENHGGEVGVHSKEGEGSTFYFTLPVVHRKQN